MGYATGCHCCVAGEVTVSIQTSTMCANKKVCLAFLVIHAIFLEVLVYDKLETNFFHRIQFNKFSSKRFSFQAKYHLCKMPRFLLCIRGLVIKVCHQHFPTNLNVLVKYSLLMSTPEPK